MRASWSIVCGTWVVVCGLVAAPDALAQSDVRAGAELRARKGAPKKGAAKAKPAPKSKQGGKPKAAKKKKKKKKLVQRPLGSREVQRAFDEATQANTITAWLTYIRRHKTPEHLYIRAHTQLVDLLFDDDHTQQARAYIDEFEDEDIDRRCKALADLEGMMASCAQVAPRTTWSGRWRRTRWRSATTRRRMTSRRSERTHRWRPS
jgi:hypothetical protein